MEKLVEGDFVAVYDKKLLWRAQLYVDERKNTDGTNVLDNNGAYSANVFDWNDEFTWAAGNDWNTGGNGGQIEILPWTVPYDPDEEDDPFDSYLVNGQPVLQVHNAVAYTHGGMDSPQDFNADLLDQQGCLNITQAGGYLITLAPDNEWRNYKDEPQPVGNPAHYAYRPVWTSILLNPGTFFDYTDTYGAQDTDRAAGVDCSGFIQRAASYPGNAYSIRDVRWDGSAVENRLTWDEYDSGVKIAIHDQPTSFYEQSWLVYNATMGVGDIFLVVPGDVILMEEHIVLVNKVDFAVDVNGNINIERMNIYGIESSTPNDNWQVIGNEQRTLAYFNNAEWLNTEVHNLEVRRLINQ